MQSDFTVTVPAILALILSLSAPYFITVAVCCNQLKGGSGFTTALARLPGALGALHLLQGSLCDCPQCISTTRPSLKILWEHYSSNDTGHESLSQP
ncbi:hypothetical protein VZT92_022325 [Zoarces viviparus]